MAFGNRVDLPRGHDVEIEIGPLVPGPAPDRAKHADGEHTFVVLAGVDDRPQQCLVPGRAWQRLEKRHAPQAIIKSPGLECRPRASSSASRRAAAASERPTCQAELNQTLLTITLRRSTPRCKRRRCVRGERGSQWRAKPSGMAASAASRPACTR